MKKVTKIKWKNLFKFILLLLCISVIVHDFYMLSIYSIIHKVTVTWSWYGLLTFVLSGFLSEYLFDDLFNEKD